MVPILAERFEALEQRRARLFEIVDGCDAAQLSFRPNPSHWSILDVAQHLVLVEERSLAQATDPNYTFKRRPGFVAKVRMTIVNAVVRSGIRVKAPVRAVVPVEEVPAEVSRHRFEEVRGRLRAFLDAMGDAEARAPKFEHPIGGPIVSAAALEFLANHFDSHLRQIERIRSSPGYPKSARAAGR